MPSLEIFLSDAKSSFCQYSISIGISSRRAANDGRFKVIAQRSYRHLLSGAYGVFSEEHEHIMRLGIPFDNNWLQANAYVTQPNGAAYEFRHDENSIVSWRE